MEMGNMELAPPRHCTEVAFDIDGVVADTMAVFVDLARERFGLSRLRKQDLRCYDLYRCLGIDRRVLDEMICLTLSDEQTLRIPPMPGAPQVLRQVAEYGPLRFVTARIWPDSIIEWLQRTLHPVPAQHIKVVATGAPEAKAAVLRELGVRYFVEDRAETCEMLARDGIQPLLFDQPWNQEASSESFPRVAGWAELGRWLLPHGLSPHV
jgi:hypothetical protein